MATDDASTVFGTFRYWAETMWRMWVVGVVADVCGSHCCATWTTDGHDLVDGWLASNVFGDWCMLVDCHYCGCGWMVVAPIVFGCCTTMSLVGHLIGMMRQKIACDTIRWDCGVAVCLVFVWRRTCAGVLTSSLRI